MTIAFDDGTVETRSLYKWAQEYQINIRTIYSRYYAGERGMSLLAPKKGDTLSEDDVHRLWGGKFVELKDAIAQLEDLIKDRKSFIVDDNSIEWNEIWLRDIEALKIGIAAIKRLLEKGGLTMDLSEIMQEAQQGIGGDYEQCSD